MVQNSAVTAGFVLLRRTKSLIENRPDVTRRTGGGG